MLFSASKIDIVIGQIIRPILFNILDRPYASCSCFNVEAHVGNAHTLHSHVINPHALHSLMINHLLPC